MSREELIGLVENAVTQFEEEGRKYIDSELLFAELTLQDEQVELYKIAAATKIVKKTIVDPYNVSLDE